MPKGPKGEKRPADVNDRANMRVIDAAFRSACSGGTTFVRRT
jgi:hypothetical protein